MGVPCTGPQCVGGSLVGGSCRFLALRLAPRRETGIACQVLQTHPLCGPTCAGGHRFLLLAPLRFRGTEPGGGSLHTIPALATTSTVLSETTRRCARGDCVSDLASPLAFPRQRCFFQAYLMFRALARIGRQVSPFGPSTCASLKAPSA